MMAFLTGALRMVVDVGVYIAIALVLLAASLRCFVPVRRNARALRRAARTLAGEGKLTGARPSWNDVNFLGAGLREDWASFLQNAELLQAHGETCDVEDYINADVAIHNAANPSLTELTPGVLVSLGILGTFLGIVMALRGINLKDPSLITQTIQSMIGGMFLAFITSIAGIVASLVFNYGNRYTLGRAERALDRFLKAFRQYAMPKPADTDVKMLAAQQEQNQYMRSFVEEISLRTAAQIEQAILRALLPVQRSMDNFIMAATREQVEGVDRIASRFVERMDLVLGGQFLKLGETLAQLDANNRNTQADLQSAAAAISSVTQEALQMRQYTQALFAQMDASLRRVQEASEAAQTGGERTEKLLENLRDAAEAQARYADRLQAYQSELQTDVQQYALWANRLFDQTELQGRTTSEGLARVSAELQDSAALLQNSYESFVENIQAGLARALGMLDENIGGIATELRTAMNGIHATVAELPGLMAGSARRYGAQVDQFVSALSQLQKSMQSAAAALAEPAARKEGV